MKKFLTLLLVAAITVCISSFIYLKIRYPHLEEKQKTLYQYHSEQTYAKYNSYFSRETLDVDGIKLIFSDMLEKDRRLTLVFGIDNYNNLVTSSFKEGPLDSDYYNGVINKLVTLYNTNSDLYYVYNQKYYVSRTETDKCIVMRVYPFSLQKNVLFMFILECILVCAVAVIAVLSIFILFTRKKAEKNHNPKQETETEHSHALNTNELQACNTEVNNSIETRAECTDEEHRTIDSFKSDEQVIQIENRRTAQKKIRNFESYIFNLFYRMSIKFKVRSLALYLYDANANDLKKVYELFGSAFVKTPPQNSLEVEKNLEIISALMEDSVIVRDNSRKIMVPLFSDTDFTGMLIIKNDAPVSGSMYQGIRVQSQGIGNYLTEELHKKAV